MAYEVVIKKRFSRKLHNVLSYLKKEWGGEVAHAFLDKIQAKINALSDQPYIGQETSEKDIRSIFITKHNRMYYTVKKNKVVILNMYDTRSKAAGK